MQLTPQLVQEAAARLSGVVVRTPLVRLGGDGPVTDIYIKPEVLQPIGSFKLRGAYNALALIVEEQRPERASTISTGNMSQAVAWSARHFGLPATAVMPAGAPEAKINATRSYGADIDFIPRDELFLAMEDGRYAADAGFVHPFGDPRVAAGNGTIGLEILADLPDVDTIFVPVGGGGLLTGIATAAKSVNPQVRVIGVEPEGCCAVTRSIKAGEPQSMVCNSFVDSAGSPFVFAESIAAIQRLADDLMTVPDDATKAAMRRLALRNKLVAEGAGALSVAAALATPPEVRGKTVCVVSGGSVDAQLLAEILTDGR